MVGIVVVTYNRLNMLQEVIASLRNQSYCDYEIVVVNNGSTDGTKEWLETQKDIIAVSQENVGGAGGFFTGLKYVAEHGFEYCWLMDDDVVCSQNALEELVKAINIKPGIGFVCSKVQGIDGRPMNMPAVDNRPSENGYPDFLELMEHQMLKVLSATFVSVLIPVDIIFEKGLPYKEYFIWGDDVEYTTRISQTYPCYVACKSIVTHKRAIQKFITIENEKDPNRLKMFFYNIRNAAYNNKKYYKASNFGLMRMGLEKALHYALQRHYQAAMIVLKATIVSLKFNPEVKYPER